MKIFIILTLVLSTLFSVGLNGKLDLELDSSKDSVEGGLRYFYSLSTIVGEPRAECTAQWSISKVHFNSIRDVGENLTYDVCSGAETSSCVPEEIMGKAGIVKLSLLGSGYIGFGRISGYSYLFGAGVMSKPKVVSNYYPHMDIYGKRSINTPWSTNWAKSFYINGNLLFGNPFAEQKDDVEYYDKESAQEIMASGIYFSSFKIKEIRFNLSEIRLYIQKREKDKKSKKKLDDFDDLLASTEDTNSNSNSSSDDMFDDTPQGRQSNDSNDIFDDSTNGAQNESISFEEMLDDTERIKLHIYDVPTNTNKNVITIRGKVENISSIDTSKILFKLNGLEQMVSLNRNGTFENKIVLFNGQNDIDIVYTSATKEERKHLTIHSSTRPVKARFTLTWDSSGSDMDLHVHGPSGEHCSYQNDSTKNMKLDVDNTKGYGPENISVLLNNQSGRYKVYIKHYSANSANVTLYVYLDNRLVATKKSHLSRKKNWHAYDLNID